MQASRLHYGPGTDCRGVGRRRDTNTTGIVLFPFPARGVPAMPSPFPGMDPYLEEEKTWPGFQHHLVHALHQILLPGLMDRYRARITQRHYVSEQALFTSILREEHTEPV